MAGKSRPKRSCSPLETRNLPLIIDQKQAGVSKLPLITLPPCLTIDIGASTEPVDARLLAVAVELAAATAAATGAEHVRITPAGLAALADSLDMTTSLLCQIDKGRRSYRV